MTEHFFSERVIYGKTLSETWCNMLSQFKFKNTEIILGLVTVIEDPLAESRWPNEIDEEVRKLGYSEVKDYLVGPVPTATANRVNKQLDEALLALNQPGCEERAIALILNPSDLTRSVRLDRNQELPIFTYLDFKKIGERLYLIASLRNCEVFVKWVMDVLWLSEQMRKALNKTSLKCGALILFADKAYIEKKNYEKVRKIVEKYQTHH